MPLRELAMEVQRACRAQSDLRTVMADDTRRIQVAFNCVPGSQVGGVPGRTMNREDVLHELEHCKVSDVPPACDERSRCCTFVRDAGTPQMQATMSEACFDGAGRLERLVIVEQDACTG